MTNDLPEAVDLCAKLRDLREHLSKLSSNDREIVVDAWSLLENGVMPLERLPQIAYMQVPGEEDLPFQLILKEGTVSVPRKQLGQVIWRYMPIEGLLALLVAGKLHFSPLSLMADTTEGELPPRALDATVAQLPEQFRDEASRVSGETVVRSLMQHRKEMVSISCWYIGEAESITMWKKYASGNGVAIRSSVERLFRALSKVDDPNIHIDQVVYFKPAEEDQYTDQAFLGSLYIKHAEPYEKERELRALAANGRYKSGIDVPIDVTALIEKVILSPELREWAVEPIRATIQKLGVTCPIERSSVAR